MPSKQQDPKAFDLDAVIAEATGEPFRFTLGGKAFELPPVSEIDWQVAINLTTGTMREQMAALASLLGDAGEEFLAMRVPQRALEPLFRAYLEHGGVTTGESLASTGS